MSSRSRIGKAAAAGWALLFVAACHREERHNEPQPFNASIKAGESPPTIIPGGGPSASLDPRAADYANNSPALAEGQFLYTHMNCVGCHAHGGGGMGPALMDDKWRYGGRIDQIAATIAEGRPNGMPAWKGKLTEDQIWKLAAYVRSLSGQPSKDAVSSRADAMSTGTPQILSTREPVKNADAAGR
jgi:cytochrome c oxidase cbb3-type subunit 3